MTVQLMLTCLCDAFYGDVGIATVRVLEHAGCAVAFPEGQTCCGQPPFNAGDWTSARRMARHWISVFRASDAPVVTPSSSCAAMIREGLGLIGIESSIPVFELSEFLVRRLDIRSWPLATAPSRLQRHRIVYHRACHSRALGLSNEQELLLASIPGMELVPLGQPEQCCGFGGAFSVGHPTISAGIGLEKLRHVDEAGAKVLVSGDMGCLMHLKGLIAKHGLALETRHFAEILAEAIPAKVPA